MVHRFAMKIALGAAVVTLAFATPAPAAQRTFVASDGNDLNNCSLNAPCRSFTRALTLTDPDGEVVVKDSAGYGAATILQSVSIIAPPGIYAGVTVFSGDGIAITGTGVKVALRGLAVNGQGGGVGIRFSGSGRLHIENCIVSNFSNVGIFLIPSVASTVTISDTIARGNQTGIRAADLVTGHFDRLRVEGSSVNGFQIGGTSTIAISNTIATGNVGDGIRVIAAPPGAPTLSVNHVESNNNGVGMHVESVGGAEVVAAVQDSTFSGNSTNGIEVASTGTRLSAQGNLIAGNGGHGLITFNGSVSFAKGNTVSGNAASGLRASGSGSTLTASGNLISGNAVGLSNASATLKSTGDNVVEGNTTPSSGAITAANTL
jgi:hypothetical protein